MATTIPEFWQLVTDSGLLTPEQCQSLRVAFGQVRGASVQSNARTLAEWLISRNVLTRYQTSILLAGHPGPFLYGAYKLYDRVDSGPFDGMFRAMHAATGHPVLLRFLTGDAIRDPRNWAVMSAQWNVHCRVHQPNLQRCFEVVDLDAYKFLVLEDLAGRPLDTALEPGKRLTPPEASRIVRSVALALDALHRESLAHGDVRPTRIWLEKSGFVKLLRDPPADMAPIDFLQPDPEGALLARADYLAPDFLQAEKSADALTDIYALGCVFHHLLTGQPPFPGGDIRQKMVQHANQPVKPLETAGIPKVIADVVASMLAKAPASRLQPASRIVAPLTAQIEPARLNISPQPAPPTLVVYEQSLSPVPPAAATAVAPVPTPVAGGRAAPASVASVAGPRPVPGAVAGSGIPVATVSAAPTAARSTVRPKRKKNSGPLAVGIGLGAAVLLIFIGLVILNNMGGGTSPRPQPSDIAEQSPWDEPSPVRPNEGSGPTGTGSERPAVESARGSFTTVADDGQTPWLPPTSGSPVVLQYVPPGSQLYLIARPADLLASSEGVRSLEALGPSFAASRAAWESAAGCLLGDVRQLILTVHQAGQDFPRPAVVVQLTQPTDKAALLQRWGNPSPVTLGNAEYYNSPNGWSYFVPTDGDSRTFVMGPEAQIRDVIEFQSAPPPLQLAMNKLVAASDDQRHLTILFSPNELIGNLFRDGRQWSLCEPRKIREPLDFFLGDNIEAGLLSLHFDRYAYAELLMVGRAGQGRDTLARELRGRLQEMPDRVERYVVGLNPHPYWKMVAMRYPQMIRFLHSKTRIGTEGDVAVINAALPPEAVHNLVFASEMALQSSPGEPGTVAAAPRTAAPADLNELLTRRFSIRFAQDSLEFAIRNVEVEVTDMFPNLPFPFGIRILGGDLEKSGITRNQQIRDFEQSDKPLGEILTAMMLKANPKAATGPQDPDQQLVWLVGADPESPTRTLVLITTRDAAAQRNDTLPAIFRGN
jgi:eukaryotic-like serine/threonine-protein kinase